MGAGKSNLVSIVISHLLEASINDQERVAYFYANSTSRVEDTKSAETALRSLLKQLAIQGHRALLQPVVARYDELRDISSLGKEDCISLLTGIISEYRQTNIIIDAFDELEDDDGAVVKIFISSRDHVNIGNLMDRSWACRKEILVGESNYYDIERFITMRLQDLEKALPDPIPENIKNDMECLLKEQSNGMFLWVHLSLKYLSQIKLKNPATFVDDLKSVPSGLGEAYTKLYRSLLQDQSHDKISKIHLVLSLLMCGCRDEIFESSAFLSAINYNPGKETSNLRAMDVLDLCSTFVELDPDTQSFRLIHLSVKEFLQTLTEYESTTAHALIANHCLCYLNEEEYYGYYTERFRMGISRQTYDFEYYATETWIVHSARAGALRQSPPLAQALFEFWPREGRTKKSPFEKSVGGLYKYKHADDFLSPIFSGGYGSLVFDLKPTTFFLACEYDIREEIENHLSNGWDINTTVPGGSGLSFACIGNHLELASYLIEHGARIVLGTDTCLRKSLVSAAVECQNPNILGLLLRHDGKRIMQPALECALNKRNFDRVYMSLSMASERLMEQKINMLLEYSSDLEYSPEVQREMFRGGPELLDLLLNRIPSLRVTSEILKCLFDSGAPPADIKSHLRLLLRLDSNFVAYESFQIALRRYEGDDNPLEVIKYTLEDLNPSDPSVLVSEAALRAAIGNMHNSVIFTEFLLQANCTLEISDDTILWTVRESGDPVIIDLLLRHNPVARSLPLSHVKGALDSVIHLAEVMAILLIHSPELEVDQETFTLALEQTWAGLEALQVILSRAPKIALTPELIHNIRSDAADKIMREVVDSSIPEQVTEEIIRAALGNWFCCGTGNSYNPPSLTMIELLSKAPKELDLSEETMYLTCSSTHWIMDQVFGRWPSAHVSELAVEATLGDVRRFRALVNSKPSIQVSIEAITFLCGMYNHPNKADTLKEMLSFQPSTMITEEMLLASSARIEFQGCEKVFQVFDILLTHMLCVKLTAKIIQKAAQSRHHHTRMLKRILAARKDLHFSPQSISIICSQDDPSVEFKETVDEVFNRSQSTRLGENEMHEVITCSSPQGLMTVLAKRPDAIVTESLVKCLIDEIKNYRVYDGCFYQWGRDISDEAFDMLLCRADLPEVPRQLLTFEFRNARKKTFG
ncbi:hypothetical protein P170DRAFT_507961 [Aspergillus steynii IBT 23096]|uniref:Nephrocystin 3-like N-terminal domain-containing protein n=1 Tax=Aspergillus steynii IBT 23096 TaxID=1392250 RepID=A0A2I2GK74_9EURO|nr:uncharacterized protein P170DRAFT_507961 [Aspergillus steynii IBT 23096]PLB53280.1 hypothetical protein P170DRAFT_507961 [Aspergillus steynii IBT 23096]